MSLKYPANPAQNESSLVTNLLDSKNLSIDEKIKFNPRISAIYRYAVKNETSPWIPLVELIYWEKFTILYNQLAENSKLVPSNKILLNNPELVPFSKIRAENPGLVSKAPKVSLADSERSKILVRMHNKAKRRR